MQSINDNYFLLSLSLFDELEYNTANDNAPVVSLLGESA